MSWTVVGEEAIPLGFSGWNRELFRPQASEMAGAGGVFEEVAAVDDSGRLRLQRRLRTTSGRRVVVLVLRTQLRVGAEPALSPGIALFGFTTLYETLDS